MKLTSETAADNERAGGIQVIARAAGILEVLGEAPGGMSLGDIAKAVALPRSTVQRIVSALGAAQLVRADRSDGVRLGPALLRLVSKLHTDVVTIAAPHLQMLSEWVDETVTLARISGRELAFVHVIVAEHALRVVPRVGLNLPLYSTSSGRALLALMPDEDILALVGDSYERVTTQTVKSSAALLRELGKVRHSGSASDSGETAEGVSSIAFAIETILGAYAISVVVPSARLAHKRATILECLGRCKDALLAEIGKGPR